MSKHGHLIGAAIGAGLGIFLYGIIVALVPQLSPGAIVAGLKGTTSGS